MENNYNRPGAVSNSKMEPGRLREMPQLDGYCSVLLGRIKLRIWHWNSCRNTGLVISPEKPAFKARPRSSFIALAVTATTGTVDSRCSLLSSSKMANPSDPGMCKSSRMRSGTLSKAAVTASRQLLASTTSYPNTSSMMRSSSRLDGLSSTTRMRAMLSERILAVSWHQSKYQENEW